MPPILNAPEVAPIEANLSVATLLHSTHRYDYEMVATPSFDQVVLTLDVARKNWLNKVNTGELQIMQYTRSGIYSEFSQNKCRSSRDLFSANSLDGNGCKRHIRTR